MPEDGSYLPPVVISFTGDGQDLFETMAEIKSALADFGATTTDTQLGGDPTKLTEAVATSKAVLTDFAKQVTNTHLGGDDKMLLSKLAQAQVALKAFATQVANADIGAASGPFWDAIIQMKAELEAVHADLPVDLQIENITATLAEIRALRGTLALETIGGLTAAAHPGVSGFNNPISMPLSARPGGSIAGLAAINARIAENFGGGGGGGAGLGAALAGGLWGGGGGGFISSLLSPLTMLSSIFSARFGSIGSLAGFGPEHLAMTGVGLAGSAAGGLAGGALLGAGALGVNAVGMGTDMAGIGQAAGDIKTVTSDMNALQQATALYGATSTQAAQAQAQLNYDLGSFNPVARAAVIQAADTIQGFKSMFDQYTGLAEKTGAQIITSLVQTGEAFLPEIGKAAAANMTIIKSSLTPLENWLKGPGLAIFTELENKFTKDLPTAMQAFDQAVEFVIRTLGLLAPMTGHLTEDLDKFFTKWNGEDFGSWADKVNKLVNLFQTWDAFVKILVKDIAEIFGFSAGLGKGIIQELTADLNDLHNALESSGGGSALSSLFTTHKAEMIELIKVIVQVGDAFTQMYLIAAPTLVTIATLILKLVSGFITLVDHIPGGAAALGLVLILAKLSLLGPLLAACGIEAITLQGAFELVGGALSRFVLGLITLDPMMWGLVAVVAIVVGALALFSGSSQSAAKWAKAFAEPLTSMATNTMPEMTAKAADLTAGIHKLYDEFNSGQISGAQLVYTANAIGLSLQATMEMISQTNSLSTSLGTTTQFVIELAQSLNLNLGKALDTAQVKQMQQALASLASTAEESTGAFAAQAINMKGSLNSIASDLGNAANAASDAFTQATSVVQKFAGQTNVTGAQVASFYSQSTASAQQFESNIQAALAKGYNPAIISQILQSGVSSSGALLQTLVSNTSNSFVQMVKANQAALQQIGQQVVEQAHITAEAVNATNGQVTADYSQAMSIDLALLGNASKMQVQAYAGTFQGGLANMAQIANEYGIMLPNAVEAELGLTGTVGHYQATAYSTAIASGATPAQAAVTTLLAPVLTAMGNAVGTAGAAGAGIATNLAAGLANYTPAIARAVAGVVSALSPITSMMNSILSGVGGINSLKITPPSLAPTSTPHSVSPAASSSAPTSTVTQTNHIIVSSPSASSHDLTAAVKTGIDQANDALIQRLNAGSISSA